MKRYSSARSSLALPCSSTIISQDIIYMQMSHHYRRVLNAKSNVDTSPPRTFRMHQRNNRTRSHRFSLLSSSQCSFIDEPSPSEMALVDKIVYDDKHRPEVIYRDHLAATWNHNHQRNKGQPHHDCTEFHKDGGRQTQCLRSRSTSVKSNNKKPVRAPSDLIDRHHESFVSPNPFKPRILKSNVPSRVHDLKVYHPPRRKSKPRRNEDWDIPTEVQQHEELALQTDDWLENQTTKPDADPLRLLCAQCQCGIKNEEPSSKVSIGSRDSAYNGGVSSGGESRGPTPEQANLTMITKRSATSGGECVSHICALQSENIYDTFASASVSHKDEKDKGHSSQLSKKQPKKSSNAVVIKKKTESKKHHSQGSSRSSSCSPGRQQKVTVENSQSTEEQDSFVCEPATVYPATEQTNINPKTWDDVRYAEFSQKITADILSQDILSNKGINYVFEKHIQENLKLLDMALMQKEIEMLRVQLGIAENCETSEDPLSHWNETFLLDSISPPSVQSGAFNLPGNTLVQEDNTISSILSNVPTSSLRDPSACPAPCSTRYIGVSVHNQYVQSDDLSLANNNELKLRLINNSNEQSEKENYKSVTTAIRADPENISPEILSATEATEGLTKTDSSSLKQTVREIIDEILFEHIDHKPSLSVKSIAVNSHSNKETDDNSCSSIESHSFKFDHSPTLSSVEIEEKSIQFQDNSQSTDESETSFAVSNMQVYDSTLSKTGSFSESYNSDSQIRCCFKKRKKKTKEFHNPINTTRAVKTHVNEERQKEDDPLYNQFLHSNISYQGTPTVCNPERSSFEKVFQSKFQQLLRTAKPGDTSTRRRSTYAEPSSGSTSSVDDITAITNVRERPKKPFIAKQNTLLTNTETVETKELENGEERTRRF